MPSRGRGFNIFGDHGTYCQYRIWASKYNLIMEKTLGYFREVSFERMYHAVFLENIRWWSSMDQCDNFVLPALRLMFWAQMPFTCSQHSGVGVLIRWLYSFQLSRSNFGMLYKFPCIPIKSTIFGLRWPIRTLELHPLGMWRLCRWYDQQICGSIFLTKWIHPPSFGVV